MIKLNLLIVLIVAALIGCQRAQPIPGIVEGASMAPNWLGEHQLLICKDCRFPIRYQLDQADLSTKKVCCPNCGFSENPVSDAKTQAAQRARIHNQQSVCRWDVVAAKLPDADAFGIKRVVGLPNERLEIREGDLYANGGRLIKPWNLQKQVRIPVYDSRFEPAHSDVGDRWKTDGPNSAWFKSAGRWNFSRKMIQENQSVNAPEPIWDWLIYQHWRCCLHQSKRDDRYPLEDIDAFNPSKPRSLNPMADACFEIHLRASGDAECGWRCFRGSEVFEFRLSLSKHELVLRQKIEPSDSETELPSQVVYQIPENLLDPAKLIVIEVSMFDGQLLTFINRYLVIKEPLCKDLIRSALRLPRVFEVGGSQGEITIERFRIWRDIFYLPVNVSEFTVPKDSFLLLGDNVPVSVDSRHWNSTGIHRKNILGVVNPEPNR